MGPGLPRIWWSKWYWQRIEFVLLEKLSNNNILALATNQHGNHVINICLSRFPHSEIDFIVNAFVVNCKEISSHKHGWMVMQKCLFQCSDSQRSRLCAQIVKESFVLSQDQYGNYIVQNIIQINDFEQNQEMLKIFIPHLIILCSQKFSSNVIEKVSFYNLMYSALRILMISLEICFMSKFYLEYYWKF